MAREGSVVFRFLGDIRDLANKVRQAENEVSGLAQRSEEAAEQATSSIEIVTDQAEQHFSSSFSRLTSVLGRRFGAVGEEVEGRLNSFASSAISSFGAVGTAATAAVGTAAVAAVALAAKGVKAFQELTSEVRAFQRVSGASAEDASLLVNTLKTLGVDANAGGRAIFALSKNIDGNAEKLRAHGIEIVRNKSGSVDLYATLLKVRDAYQAAGKGAEGNTIAAAAFGRAGQSLLPILGASADRLNDIKDAAERHGQIVSDEDLETAKDYSVATKEMQQAVTGLEMELGKGLLPALTDVAKNFTTIIELSNKVAKPVGGLAGLIKGALKLPGVFGVGAKVVEIFGDDSEDAAADVDVLAGELEGLVPAADKAAEGLAKFGEVTGGILDSTLGIPSAVDDVSAAFAALEDDAESSSKRAADAQDRLADAIESANRRIRDARQDADDAREDLGKMSEGDRTDARRRLRDAEERLADARADSAEAIQEAKDNAAELAPAVKDAATAARETRGEMDKVVTATEKAVLEMIKYERPFPEILGFIQAQRDRMGEVGTRIGANRKDLELYSGVLGKVYEQTKALADFTAAQSLTMNKDFKWWGVDLTAGGRAADQTVAGTGGVTVNQFFQGADPAEQQRQAVRGFNGALRRRG